jgi:hypothetical protein
MQLFIVVLLTLALVTSLGHPLIDAACAAIATGVVGGLLHWFWSNREVRDVTPVKPASKVVEFPKAPAHKKVA